MKIAFLQIAPAGDLQKNMQKGVVACRKAKELGADLALFPEMFSNGYDIYERPVSVWSGEAIGREHPFILAFSALAKELEMAIGITYLEQGLKNSLALFDRNGKRVLDYAKVHTCDFGAERDLTPGDGFKVATLETAEGPVKVGAMICYDREFPESARLLMLQGAELVLVPNACPMEINRLAQLRGRAYENMMAIATCNYPGSVPDCNGHSSLFDGVAYLPELDGSRDTCLLETGEEEGVYTVELDLAMLRSYREQEVHGNAYRRPALYGGLTEQRIEAPFIRKEYRSNR